MQQSWEDVLRTSLVHDKHNLFMIRLCAAVDMFVPVKSFRISLSDKPWISAKIKALILDRQRCLHMFGKDSASLKRLVMQSNDPQLSSRPLLGRTDRFNDFITLKFQHVI